MPVAEPPSYNSTRVQKAHRINTIEQSRLKHTQLVMEKEKLHGVRLLNQDIRLMNITLEHIQTSSGSSTEGRPPEYQDRQDRQELGSLYQYGEKVVNRSQYRLKRARSAVDRSVMSRTGSHSSISSSQEGSSRLRPLSTPLHRGLARVTSIYSDSEDDAASEDGSEGRQPTRGPPGRVTWSAVARRPNSIQEGDNSDESADESPKPPPGPSRRMTRAKSAAPKLAQSRLRSAGASRARSAVGGTDRRSNSPDAPNTSAPRDAWGLARKGLRTLPATPITRSLLDRKPSPVEGGRQNDSVSELSSKGSADPTGSPGAVGLRTKFAALVRTTQMVRRLSGKVKQKRSLKLYGEDKTTFLLDKKRQINQNRKDTIMAKLDNFLEQLPKPPRYDALEPPLSRHTSQNDLHV